MINDIDPTFNVLVQLVIAGESKEALLERAEMNGCRLYAIDPFGQGTDSAAFITAKEFLNCSYDDLFRPRTESLDLLLKWLTDAENPDAIIARNIDPSSGDKATCISLSLEDNSLLCLKVNFPIGKNNPDYCSVKLLKDGRKSFLNPFVQTIRTDGTTNDLLALAKYPPATQDNTASASPSKKTEEGAKSHFSKVSARDLSATGKTTTKVSSGKRTVRIKPTDAFVRLETSNYKHHGHTIEAVNAEVEIRAISGNIRVHTVTAYYCKNCKKYYISIAAYEQLKSHGYICCQVFKQNEINKDGTVIALGSRGRHLQSQSLIHSYGYNVGKKDDLSTTERQAILRFIVDNKIMNPLEITGFLEFLIGRAETQTGKNMDNAIARWKEDIGFLETVISAKRTVRVKAINERHSKR